MIDNPDSIMNQMTSVETVSGRTAFDAMRKGDAAAKKVCDTYIEYIAAGMVDLMNIFRPEVFIIGGGICNEGDTLLVPIRKYVNEHIYGGDRNPEQKIAVAQLGNDAGIIGAAFIVK